MKRRAPINLLTRKAAQRAGYLVGKVESFNKNVGPHGVFVDLWNFADFLAVSHQREPQRLLIQATSESNRSSRLAKLKNAPEVRRCILAGIAVELWTWLKVAGRWRLRRTNVGLNVVTDAVARPRRSRKAKQAELFA